MDVEAVLAVQNECAESEISHRHTKRSRDYHKWIGARNRIIQTVLVDRMLSTRALILDSGGVIVRLGLGQYLTITGAPTGQLTGLKSLSCV